MEIIESTQILKNLNKVLEKARSRFSHEFIQQEVCLNDTFKLAFRDYLVSKNCDVEYYDKTTVVTNSSGQHIYIANQWFAIASYFVDFCTELLTYRTLFVKICKFMSMDATAMKDYATRLKILPTEEDKSTFLNTAMNILRNDFPDRENEYENIAGYLWEFASNYKWWAGSKTVDRHDFYISALLNQMNVVNNNSEYLAIIVHSYASTLKLRILVENIENFTIGMQLGNSDVKIEDDVYVGIVSEPTIHTTTPQAYRSKGISISAASLERFQSQS